jgi:hypothetical protein
MRSAYRFLAYAIPVLVVVQAASIAFGLFGLGAWVDNGHTFTKAMVDGNTNTSFTGDVGFAIHGINGEMLIPLVALILLVVSFFAKIPGGVKWAAIVLLVVVIQVALAFVAFGAPVVGALHGLNAFVLFGLALMAAQRVNKTVAPAAPARV